MKECRYSLRVENLSTINNLNLELKKTYDDIMEFVDKGLKGLRK